MIFSLDPLYWVLVGPTALLALLAQAWVMSAYRRWQREPASCGLSGAEVAHYLAQTTQQPVRVELAHGGELSDHYDPSTRTLRLSPAVYHGRSVAAIAIAAHEAGHALQHATGYPLLAMRSSLVPLASLGSWLALPLIVAGLALSSLGLTQIGLVLFGTIVLFQVVTLPVEFDASARARRLLRELGFIRSDREAQGVGRVLNAAAWTYVAATATALAQLLYFMVLAQQGRQRDA